MRGVSELREWEGNYVLTCMHLPTAHLKGHGRFLVCFEAVQVAGRLPLFVQTLLLFAPSVPSLRERVLSCHKERTFQLENRLRLTALTK